MLLSTVPVTVMAFAGAEVAAIPATVTPARSADEISIPARTRFPLALICSTG